MAEFETIRMSVEDARSATEPMSVTLVLYHSAGTATAALREGGSLRVGREADCDVVIPDESLSRYHARFRLLGGQLFVEDLGSTNGTRVGERTIEEEAPLNGGELVSLGNVAVRFSNPRGAASEHNLDGYDAFLQHVDDEVVRSRHKRHRLAVLAVRASARDHAGTLVPVVAAPLSPIDRVALYSREVLLVLVPETDDAATKKLAEELGAKSAKKRLFVGAASYPGSGATAAELIDVARGALRRATLDSPVSLAIKGAQQLERKENAVGPVVAAPVMVDLYSQVERLHKSSISVLLHGETGTGKEVVARAIHEGGARGQKPLVTINCGAIPSELVESQLFGHEPGAFTDAKTLHKGIFESADGGTVFLDEVGELPLETQKKFLRVLQEKKIQRVGSTKDMPVDVRVVAASHKDLEQMVAAGTFREDLYFRLNVITLAIPPLRERKEEIVPLAERFLTEAAKDAERPAPKLTHEAYDLLLSYPWPGNVRELKNAMDRAAVMARGDTIGPGDLPDRLRRFAAPVAKGAAAPVVVVEADAGADLKTLVRRYEARVIEEALNATHGNQTLAAQRLRTPLRTLVHKIKALGVRKPEGDAGAGA